VPVELGPAAARSTMPLLAMGLLLGSLTILAQGRRTAGGAKPAADAGTPNRKTPGESDEPMIRISNLTKRYGRFTAVNDVSFDVEPGEALALWGRNGAGKTTVIRCLLGLTHSEGRIVVGGRDLRRQGKLVRRTVGYVPQELAFYDDMTALGCLTFYARIKRVAIDRCRAVIREVGLEQHERKRVAEMSGGMKQRLALAAALLADPPLLLLDEMTSNLDAKVRAGFISLLLRLKRDGKTILFTSHRLDEVEALADRVLVMNDGVVELSCRGAELAASVGLQCRLKLSIGADQVDQALATLRERGFESQRNGSGLWVHVEPHAKLAPVEALLAARIRLDDFELAGDDEEWQS
jgi:ABC-type multidrug transport system ATPase subunit